MDIFPKNTWPNGHFPNLHFPEWTLFRMYIWPNGHFSENPFSRMASCQNVQLMLAIIIQDDEIKLFFQKAG